MSLRVKLSLMLSSFLILIGVFAAGTLVIFENLSVNMSRLNSVSQEYRITRELESQIYDVLHTTRNWGLTGESKFRKQYQSKLADVYAGFEKTRQFSPHDKILERIEVDFRQVAKYAQAVIDIGNPVGDPRVIGYLQLINLNGKEIIDEIARMHTKSLNTLMEVATRGEEVKMNMVYYLFTLIVFSTITAVFLIVRIRSLISDPFHELLKATERISRGELSYRINMNRKDEFGIVSRRFDHMISELESSNRKISRKLEEFELFLDVARIAGTTLDLRDALSLITETIAAKMKIDNCSIYMLHPEKKAFCIAASNDRDEMTESSCLPVGEGLADEILGSLGTVVIEDISNHAGLDDSFKKNYSSALAVPIIRDTLCTGILAVRSRSFMSFSADEINTLKIVAHTSGSVIRNSELYLSTKKQLQKLTVLFELSRAVTSVLDLEELLTKIAKEIARLLSSRGCIIRLLENDRLKIKSFFGLPQGIEDEMELAIGEGIAGWVAANGSPLLVEDASKLPAEMQLPALTVKSVICVPLKAGEKIIGTLGLYDKFDFTGNVVSFTVEDLNTAEGFASISSLAIDKSKIYENEVEREKEAREAKKRMDLLFDSVQGGIVTLNSDFTVISVNKYVEDWLNLSSDQLVGRNSLEIFHDKVGICPHCAAAATFETGEINSVMQSRGVNYAELTAYPVKRGDGKIVECVVFIQDITERVLYQEETLSLYREVIQTKEYLESIIENSADAIVITDLEGIITSWNQGAEKIFGFNESEAMGKFLPFVPDFLMEKERENIDKIRRGEVLKDVETLRQRKDGTIIEVSLTLSPIKDPAGEVIGISGISRDISEKKTVEKELIRRNQELSRLFFISSAMRGTLELDKLLRMVLVAVTMSDGMGFNRAILFLVDEAKGVVRGAMGVGPSSPEEAWKVWDELTLQKKSLEDILQEVSSSPQKKDSFLDKLSSGLEIPISEDTMLSRAVREKRSFNVKNASEEELSDPVLIQQLGTQAYAVVPLISRDKVIGIIWVDNYFNRKQITDEDMKFLASFSNHVASAIENARLFEQVTMAEQQLENIFESMSDMVYFNNKDYVIQSVNKAVSSRIGLPASEIVGKKCYEVFHGMNEPYAKCPHHKTVTTKKAYIEELEDPHMGGTFLTSSSPIFDLTGEFIGSVHVVRDITELKNLQEKLVMSEKMAALGEVAAKVAHEIRNPLVSVGGFAKRLEKKLEGNLKEYAGIIVNEVERLEGILREILGFVKEVRLSRENTDLNSLVNDVILLMETEISERGITLFKDFGRPAKVFIDRNRVKEALLNIITNAVQSLAGQGAVYVRTYADDVYAVVEIEDTGRGISEKDIPFVFNPFYTTKASGTGLGLAITHRIVQEHNGKIDLETKLDKGTKFRVYIPLKEGQE